ncbi:CPBP family glutamic-type intramembrane protease [Oleiagrimonas sp. C23AA]|uniref:CPBP family glutamic-type intramembrane protease n=1 Tax=Oleiagrimonas sp. C23AA TaxID=2719047 RepID=UPI0014244AB5|nr:CPBP family glutamic-type intramembrane protease [Oleiagrimonas sp. C23AA]NII09391.1 hypothetical protein [Oleiagrimonas sp. C23AA]
MARPTAPRTARIASLLSGAAIIVALAAALYLLAGFVTGHELARRGAVELQQLKQGVTPWHWRLRGPANLVAQRPFGQARAGSERGQRLRLTAESNAPYEIGLPLSRPADLATAHWLTLEGGGQRPLHMALIRSATLDGAGCRASLPLSHWPRWDLAKLDWRPDQAGACRSAHATVLRLALTQPAGKALTLRKISLRADTSLAIAQHVVPLPDDLARARALLAQLAAATPSNEWLQIALPALASSQRILALSDLTHQMLPAATVVLGSETGITPPAPPQRAWIVLLIYVLLMGASIVHRRAERPQHPRAWRMAQLALALAGPLWLIAGMHLGLHTRWPYLLAAVLGIVYGGWVSRRLRLAGAPRAAWLGQARAWTTPWLVVVAALILAWGAGHIWQPLGWRHIATYLAWALLQQWLMLAVVLRLFESAWPTRTRLAVIGTALAFALLHTPNARLMLLCFGAELWWARSFLRNRAIIPIALAHALAALILQSALADGWLRSLEVSARYLLGG